MGSSNPVTNQSSQDYASDQLQDEEYDAGYEELIDGIDQEGLGELGDSPVPSHVTIAEIRELYQKVESTNSPDEQKLLDILKEAQALLYDPDNSNDVLAAQKFGEVSSALEVEAEVDGEEGEGGSGSSEPPTSSKNGVDYFEFKDKSQALDFFPGQGKEHVIETLGPVSFNPDPNAQTEVNEVDGHIVVTVTSEDKKKVDTYKIKIQDPEMAKNFEIQINAKEVKGSYDGDLVKVGGKKFLSEDKLKNLANQLEAGAAMIGGDWLVVGAPTKVPNRTLGLPSPGPDGKDYTMISGSPQVPRKTRVLKEGKKYAAPDEAKEEAVRKLLVKMAAALRETDSKKRAKLWDEFNVELRRLDTNTEKKGHVNDQFHLLAAVLYGQWGEEGLKEVLQNGLIPPEVAKTIGNGMMSEAGEINNGDYRRVLGGPPWTHQTFAEFFDKYSQANPSGSSSSVPDPNNQTMPPPPAQ